MGAGEDILKRLAVLETKVDRLLAHLGADRPANGGSQTQGGRVASPKEIQGKNGDVKIRIDPREWAGESFKGRFASQCPPDFLEVYANMLDGFADNPKEGKDPKWDRLDAARCRRWAVEIREGRVNQQNGPEAAPPTPRSNGNPPPADDGWYSNNDGDNWS